MWGIIPAAGRGTRIQPLAFSKELLPVGSRVDGADERPCAVSEYVVERLISGGADKLCFVIAPGKSDILEYYSAGYGSAPRRWSPRTSPSLSGCLTRSGFPRTRSPNYPTTACRSCCSRSSSRNTSTPL